jgi:tripartite-type tricarboxylate transporter receptor subunit TctC
VRVALCLACALSAGVLLGAFDSYSAEGAATAYPVKPIRVLVGFAPGGGSDILGRMIAQKLNESWGYPVIIDNRPGAGGTIVMEIATRSVPDGYTLLLMSGSQITNASLFTKTKSDVLKSLAPISQLTSQPYVLLANPALPVNSVREFIALAKSKPGGLTCGSSGSGSFAHLGIELFNNMAGVRLMHIPYKGTGQATIDLIAGQIDLTLASAISATPHMKTGRLRAIAVTTLKRSAVVPDVPSIAESGVPGYEVAGWYGLAAPAGTAAAVITKLNAEITRILAAPEAKTVLAGDGAEAVSSTPREFTRKIDDEIQKWTKVVNVAGIRLE